MRKKWSLLHVTALIFITQVTWAGDVKTEKVTLVGERIVEFIPENMM